MHSTRIIAINSRDKAQYTFIIVRHHDYADLMLMQVVDYTSVWLCIVMIIQVYDYTAL